MERRSGRQSARGSGRATARTSGRGEAESPRPSARTSARSSARESGVRASGRTSQRGDAETSGRRSTRRSNKGDGMVIGIALGVIALMVVGAIVVYSNNNSKIRDAKATEERIKKAREDNEAAGLKYMQLALEAGAPYIRGDMPDAKEDALFGALRGQPDIYNVIFERSYKDRRNKSQTEQKKMNGNTSYNQTCQDWKKEDITIHTGTSSDGQALVVSKRQVAAKEGDKANLGGWVIVMVKGIKEE